MTNVDNAPELTGVEENKTDSQEPAKVVQKKSRFMLKSRSFGIKKSTFFNPKKISGVPPAGCY